MTGACGRGLITGVCGHGLMAGVCCRRGLMTGACGRGLMSGACCRRGLYGVNTIAVHVTPIIKLLFTQVMMSVVDIQ